MKHIVKNQLLLYAMLLVATTVFAQLSERAPDVLPGTLPEMREPSYWIARMENPDDIILTVEQIEQRNESFKAKMYEPDPFKNLAEERKSQLLHYFPGLMWRVPDFRNLKPEAVSDSVRERIEIEIDYIKKGEFGNSNGVKYSEREINELFEEMALDMLKPAITVRDGIAVRTTHLKNVPAFAPEFIGLVKQKDRTQFDQWNFGILKIGKPVCVLHPSRSGEFVFVSCEVGMGWVRSEDVAFAERNEIEAFIHAKDFMVCTGDRVQFYSDKSSTYASGWFRMGDRLPQVSVNDRRRVKVPVRKMNGDFATETAWLAVDADVSVGFLPYTRCNIVETAFKLIDNAYDFTGTFFGRQHESTYRDIFACFGFDLPHFGSLFTHYGDNEFVLHPEIGREEQYRKILEFVPFVTLMTTLQDRGGHCQLLLGEYNGVPIVFDQHGYGYTDENGNELIIRRCCVDDIAMPAYFLQRKITFLELK
ncbi:MAG: SH3 domain-containing protein [Candidatus Latescibacteria bacterium]|nr:SH3 domain-containing protein [Candidatus Latescibacterota bacterium]